MLEELKSAPITSVAKEFQRILIKQGATLAHVAAEFGISIPAVHKYKLKLSYNRLLEICDAMEWHCPDFEDILMVIPYVPVEQSGRKLKCIWKSEQHRVADLGDDDILVAIYGTEKYSKFEEGGWQ